MVLDQLQKDSSDIMNLIKKEKNERERDSNVIKERIDNERKELQVGKRPMTKARSNQKFVLSQKFKDFRWPPVTWDCKLSSTDLHFQDVQALDLRNCG